jgi:hypothetical protein
MTDHDLATMMRDHLAGEPPLETSSAEVIRAARRQGRRRGVLAAAAGALALAAVVTLAIGARSTLVDDAPPPTTVAREPATPLTDQMQAAAERGFAPYVGALGEPQWTINALLGEPVEADDPAAQSFQLVYRPERGSLQVNLSVGGFAPDDLERYSFADSCDQQKAQHLVASCEIATLDDGALLMTTVAPRARIGGDSSRMLTLEDAASRPAGSVAWVRVVSLSTLDGMALDAAEYVRAEDAASARWQVPVRELRSLVLDPALRAARVAHEPMPEFTGE